MIAADVLVIGGGFAGFWAALAAKASGGEALRVALLTREPVLQLRPRLYEAQPQALSVPLRPMLERAGVELHEGEVAGLDAASRCVTLADGRVANGRGIVLTTGSRMRRPPFPGADEAASIDTQAEAIAFDQRLAALARATATPRLAVVGAGFTGIELALELRDRLAGHAVPAACGAGGSLGPDLAERAHIMLIDAAPDPGVRIGQAAWDVIREALAQARVPLHLGARVRSLRGKALMLDDGTCLEAHATILATGLAAAAPDHWVPGAHDGTGRIVVDAFLRAPDAPGLWAAGDAAAADDGTGRLTVASCQHALQSGRFAGANAARALLGRPLLPLRAKPYVTCVDLGRHGALFTQGREREVLRHGAAAKASKQHINRVAIHPPEQASRETLWALALPAGASEAKAA